MTKTIAAPSAASRRVGVNDADLNRSNANNESDIRAELAPAIARLGELSSAEIKSLTPREILFTDARRKELANHYGLAPDTRYDEIVSYVRQLKNPNDLLADLRKIHRDEDPSPRVKKIEEFHPAVESISERVKQPRLFPEPTIIVGDSKQTEDRLSAVLFHDGVEPRFARRITNILMGELLSVERGASFDMEQFSSKLDKLMAGYRGKKGSDAHQIVAQFATELYAMHDRLVKTDSGEAKLELSQPEAGVANDDAPAQTVKAKSVAVASEPIEEPEEVNKGGILSRLQSAVTSASSWFKSLLPQRSSSKAVEYETLGTPEDVTPRVQPTSGSTLSRAELRDKITRRWGRREIGERAAEVVDIEPSNIVDNSRAEIDSADINAQLTSSNDVPLDHGEFDYSAMIEAEGLYDSEQFDPMLVEDMGEEATSETITPVAAPAVAPVPEYPDSFEMWGRHGSPVSTLPLKSITGFDGERFIELTQELNRAFNAEYKENRLPMREVRPPAQVSIQATAEGVPVRLAATILPERGEDSDVISKGWYLLKSGEIHDHLVGTDPGVRYRVTDEIRNNLLPVDNLQVEAVRALARDKRAGTTDGWKLTMFIPSVDNDSSAIAKYALGILDTTDLITGFQLKPRMMRGEELTQFTVQVGDGAQALRVAKYLEELMGDRLPALKSGQLSDMSLEYLNVTSGKIFGQFDLGRSDPSFCSTISSGLPRLILNGTVDTSADAIYASAEVLNSRYGGFAMDILAGRDDVLPDRDFGPVETVITPKKSDPVREALGRLSDRRLVLK